MAARSFFFIIMFLLSPTTYRISLSKTVRGFFEYVRSASWIQYRRSNTSAPFLCNECLPYQECTSADERRGISEVRKNEGLFSPWRLLPTPVHLYATLFITCTAQYRVRCRFSNVCIAYKKEVARSHFVAVANFSIFLFFPFLHIHVDTMTLNHGYRVI